MPFQRKLKQRHRISICVWLHPGRLCFSLLTRRRPGQCLLCLREEEKRNNFLFSSFRQFVGLKCFILRQWERQKRVMNVVGEWTDGMTSPRESHKWMIMRIFKFHWQWWSTIHTEKRRPDTIGNLPVLFSPSRWRTSTRWQKRRKDETRRETGSWETALHYVCMHSKRENSSRETWAPVSLVDGWWEMAEAIALYIRQRALI